MKTVTRVLLSELKEKKARGEISPPLPRAYSPESDLPEGFWDNAKIVEGVQ